MEHCQSWFPLPQFFPCLHQRSFLVSLEYAVLSSLTVKCIMNTCNQPFPQNHPKWHSWFPHFIGRAKAWAMAEWCRGSSICGSLNEFIEALWGAFDSISSDWEKACALSNVKQGMDSVCDYAICFRTLATDGIPRFFMMSFLKDSLTWFRICYCLLIYHHL